MISWFALNWGTILICVVLIAVVAAIVIKLRHDKKNGKSPCGGNCKQCMGVCNAGDGSEPEN